MNSSILHSSTLLTIYNEIKDKIKDSYSYEDYFYFEDHPDELTLADAIGFEIFSRSIEMYDDMVNKYYGIERIGLFALTNILEKSCVEQSLKQKFKIFDIYKYPVKLTYGDDTHEGLSAGKGNYKYDLKSVLPSISANIELKSVSNIINGLKCYSGRETKTGFPYGADYLLLFNRTDQSFYIFAKDIKRFCFFPDKSNRFISDSYQRITVDVPYRDRDCNFIYDENNHQKFNTETFVYCKLDITLPRIVNDAKENLFNKEILRLASNIVDELQIEQKHTPRHNI